MGDTSKQSTLTERGTISILKIEPERGKLRFFLEDGRDVAIPTSDIPEIKKLNLRQRRKWEVFVDDDNANLFTFESCDEIFKLTDELKIEVG